jgi:hypothetical protein
VSWLLIQQRLHHNKHSVTLNMANSCTEPIPVTTSQQCQRINSRTVSESTARLSATKSVVHMDSMSAVHTAAPVMQAEHAKVEVKSNRKTAFAAEEEEEGLHGVHMHLRRNEHPKTKEGCKKFSGKQAVTQRRPTSRKPLYARQGMWLCRQNRQSQHTQCRFCWDT